jgi:hypothetical protein
MTHIQADEQFKTICVAEASLWRRCTLLYLGIDGMYLLPWGNGEKAKDTSAYIDNLRQRLPITYEVANTAIKNSQVRQKSNYDLKWEEVLWRLVIGI